MNALKRIISVRSELFAAALAGAAQVKGADLIISQGTTMYTYQNGAVQTFYNTGDVIQGMTNVPAGMTVGTLNGGAGPGDVLALGGINVYRVDNPATAPTLTPIGLCGGPNNSPVFVGGRMFGVAGVMPQGSIIVEWDPATFAEINRWSTGVFGGPGGLVAVPGTPDEFYYSEFNSDMIWHYKLGNTFSTPVCVTPNNDYVGLEDVGGTIYASYALPGSQQIVLGTQALNGTFNQLAVLDSYGIGITGLAQLPEPSTALLLLLGAFGMVRPRQV